MSRYAETTTVGADRSRAEIERTLVRYGATSFMYGWDPAAAIVGFICRGRQVRFSLPLPNRSSRDFTHTPAKGIRRDAAGIEAAYDQAVKQRWRALALVIKAKLEAVEAGIVTFEQEFGMHFMLPNGQTVGDFVLPQIERAYALNEMPALLPGSSNGGSKEPVRT